MAAAQTRPLTIKEIQDRKRAEREADQDKVTISNASNLQPIPIQIYGKKSKLAIHQITITIPPGRKVDLPKYRLIQHQIDTLRKRGLIRVSDAGGAVVGSSDYRDFLNPNFLKKAMKPEPVAKNSQSSSKAVNSKSKPKKNTKNSEDKQ